MMAIFICLALLLAADLAAAAGCTMSVNALRRELTQAAAAPEAAPPVHTELPRPVTVLQTPPEQPCEEAPATEELTSEESPQETEPAAVPDKDDAFPGEAEAAALPVTGAEPIPLPVTEDTEPLPVTEDLEPLPVTEELSPLEEPQSTARYAPVTDSAAVQAGPAMYGRAHNIGGRAYQQDALGTMEFAGGRGLLALVADGMGGLSGGELVSGQIVVSMMEYASSLQDGLMDEVLPDMVRRVNDEINQMLGPEGLYQSGSTLVAVLVLDGMFHWISVGDSRIYLYRAGGMVQLNQEHTQLQEWMPEILNGRLSYEEAVSHPDAGKLTSFIGMGRLRHVDASLHGIHIRPQDRILLMSDGVFNTLPEPEMARILDACPDVQQAADLFEDIILRAKVPGQDNFTVMILGF